MRRLLLCLTALVGFAALFASHSQESIRSASSGGAPKTFLPVSNQADVAAGERFKKEGIPELLRTKVEALRYDFAPGAAPGKAKAFNSRQSLRALFDASGVELEPARRPGGRMWRAALRLRGYGYATSPRLPVMGVTRTDGNRVEIDRGGLTEWYVNRPEGLEQGFTIAAPPGIRLGNESLQVRMGVEGDLLPRLADGGQSIVFSERDGRQVLQYDHLTAFDSMGRSLPSWMEQTGDEIHLKVDDAAAVYPVTIDPVFTEVKRLTAPDGIGGFGYASAISGDTVVVVAIDSFQGGNGVYIYERNRGGADNWGAVKILTYGTQKIGGSSVAINGDTVVVGSSGGAYVFERNRGGVDNWGEVKLLVPSDALPGDRVGVSIAISGDTLVVGASSKDSNRGAAYVFGRNQGGANNWGEVRKLTASDGAAGDEFGFSVGIDDDTIVAGAYRKDSDEGAIYVFERNRGGGDNWGEVRKFAASDSGPDDFFGYAVAISGDTIVVGAPFDIYGTILNFGLADAAYVFERNRGGADNWGEVRKLATSNRGPFDRFGFSVGISRDVIVVGVDVAGNNNNSATVFERNRGGADNWGLVRKLTPASPASNRSFGRSVGISGNTVIVGAPSTSSSAAYIFVNNCGEWFEFRQPAASDNAADDLFGASIRISGGTAIIGAPGDDAFKGAAYVFERNRGGADNWGEVRKLTASDGAASDRFGSAVAISGDRIVVGAKLDDGERGGAYIFERNQGGADNWGEVRKLVASDGSATDSFGSSVGISDDAVVVGARGDAALTGAAYVFERNRGGADSWGEVRKLTASDGAAGDEFGYSAGISKDTIIVGARGEDSLKGAAYIFERNQGGEDHWGEVRKIGAADAATDDSFGSSVAISVNTAVVGADGDESGKGAAYVFERNRGGADNWGEVRKITSSDGAMNDRFGSSVGIEGRLVVVGAPGDDAFKGAAYVFERNQGGGDNWGEVRKLAAAIRGEGDDFGSSVDISDGRVLVGAKGTDGDSGEAYLFVTDCPPVIAGETLTRQQGNSGIVSVVANVSDDFTAVADLTVVADSVPAGIVVDSIVNNNGVISAQVTATCAATFGQHTVLLKAIDGRGLETTGTLIVNVTTNFLPVLRYMGPVTARPGENLAVAPSMGPSDNGMISSIVVQSVAPDTFAGMIGVDAAGVVSIGNAGPVGSFAVTVRATDNCGASIETTFTLVVAPEIAGGNECPDWVERKIVTAAEGNDRGYLGGGTDISGDTLVIGSPEEEDRQGAVYIYERNQGGAGQWGEIKRLTAPAEDGTLFFGSSVGISEDTLIIGGLNAFYIFERNQGGTDQWGQVKKSAFDGFAGPVAISGSTLVIGYASFDLNNGAAFIFERDLGGADNWGTSKFLTLQTSGSELFFGQAVAVSGDTIVVGAPGVNLEGLAMVFDRNRGGADNWGNVATLSIAPESPPPPPMQMGFGSAVGISEDTIVVSASAQGGNSAAYVFERNRDGANNWGEVRKLRVAGIVPGDSFGNSIDISLDTLVVGFRSNDSLRDAAYIFERDRGGADNWGEVEKLTPSDGAPGYRFGGPVAVSGDTVVVMARTSGFLVQGAAYIFTANCAPTIEGRTLARQQGSDGTVSTIAEVGDDIGPAGTLAVVAASVPAGIAVNSIANSEGVISANIAATCAAAVGANIVTLKVIDGFGLEATAELIVDVAANTAPSLGYVSAQMADSAGNLLVNPSSGPNDNGVIVGFSIQSISPNSFIGTIGVDGAGVVTIANAGPAGAYTVTVRVVDDCGAMTDASFSFGVDCREIDVAPSEVPVAFTGAPYLLTFSQASGSESVSFSLTGALPPGIVFDNATGTLSGQPQQSGSFSFTLTATDHGGCRGSRGYTLLVHGAGLSLADPLECLGPGGVVGVTATLTNNDSAALSGSFTAALPPQLVAIPGSCTVNVGSCTVVDEGTIAWSGTLAAGQTVTINYRTQAGEGAAPGAELCVVSTATLGVGSGSVTACATIDCPAVGPGLPLAGTTEASDSRAGSVLLYNLYTSSATSSQRQNTRVSLTNTDPTRTVAVHLFFVDGSTCGIADRYLCLTPNQTMAFFASDLDPGTTGYLIAVAVDEETGCPIDFDHLIGDAYVKTADGHAASLAAESISALAGGPPSGDAGALSATLAFDGVSYGRLGRSMAASNLGAIADGNETLLVLNRIGGDLGSGALALGRVFGLLYNDAEKLHSFNFQSGACQFRSTLNSGFPQTSPRFETVVPAGGVGWMRLWMLEDGALSGVVIVYNGRVDASGSAFQQGRNLHRLTLSAAGSVRIPVFPPGC